MCGNESQGTIDVSNINIPILFLFLCLDLFQIRHLSTKFSMKFSFPGLSKAERRNVSTCIIQSQLW